MKLLACLLAGITLVSTSCPAIAQDGTSAHVKSGTILPRLTQPMPVSLAERWKSHPHLPLSSV